MAVASTSSIPTEIVSAPSSEATSTTYPRCAQTCLAGATASLPCAETDSACLCSHTATIQSSVTSCLNRLNSCSASEASSAASYYNEICLRLGYPTSEGRAVSGLVVTASSVPTTTTRPPSSTASRSSTYSPSDLKSSSNATLSVPTVAGIAAGAAFLLVCIITILLCIYIRRRSTKPSNPTVTIESPDPSNPRNRVRKTVSLRQSALYSPDDPEWNEKLSHIATLTNNEKQLEHELSHNQIERKKSLPQTPGSPADTLTNDSYSSNPYDKEMSTPQPTLPPPTYTVTSTTAPRLTAPILHTTKRPPYLPLPPSFCKSLFEASVSTLSLPASHRPLTPQLNSPTATQFSDKASIYSATNTDTDADTKTHSRSISELSTSTEDTNTQQHEENDDGEIEVARASTLTIQRPQPTTLEALASPSQSTNTSTTSPNTPSHPQRHPQRPPFVSRFSSDTNVPALPSPFSTAAAPLKATNLPQQSQRPPFLSHFSSDTTVTSHIATRAPKPAPLTLRTTSTAPSALATPLRASGVNGLSHSPVSPMSPISVDVSALPKNDHIVSASSFGRFDFEVASRKSLDRPREGFMGDIDCGTEKR